MSSDDSGGDWIGSIIGAGISAASAAIGNRKQRKWAAAEAQKARDWTEYMSNTAHQREVADLREAGLNPILSATGGNGAATPTAATASAPPERNPALDGLQAATGIYNAITSGELNAASAKKAEADAKKADADAALADAQAEKIRKQTKVEGAKADAVEKSRTWLERGWDYLTDMKSVDDIIHTFGLPANAGDVERHKRQLEDKKSFQEALEQERISNASEVDVGGIYNSVPNSWQFVKSDFNEKADLFGHRSGSFDFFITYKKPNGDYVRVRRKGFKSYNSQERDKK